MEKKEKSKFPCENCGGFFIYIRIKTKERVCRSCGFIQKIKNDENKEEE